MTPVPFLTADFLSPAHQGFVGSISKPGTWVGGSRFHVGTMIKGKVYCDVHANGLSFPEWVQDFRVAGDKGVVPSVRVTAEFVGKK